MPPDEPTDEERLQELEQDTETPFSPADPNPSATGNTTDPVVSATGTQGIADDHPETDTNMDLHEEYDEGIDGAAETEDQSGQSAVTDYTPPDSGAQEDTLQP
ncbi:MAG TPA: hypothetical protein VGE30_02500 [Candidatus Saccharimonadales bacterium]